MSFIILFISLIIIGIAFRYFFLNPSNILPRNILYYILICVIVLLVFCIIIFPDESVKAAYNGLNIWFTVVLPALLPFFIGAELLVGLGIVRFIGTFLEPIMRPFFNVPGEGSFAFAMSITSGYPVGVKIASNLRREGIISKVEAQRLVSFCSTSGPLFLIGAVSVGMFKSTEVGLLLATSHYLSAIIVGLVFNFYKRSEKYNKQIAIRSSKEGMLKKAIYNLSTARNNSPSFGILLGNAVKESVNTMLMIGGFIILFSVIINILEIIGFITFISQILYFLLRPLNIELAVIKALITGLFEITMGCKEAAEAINISVVDRIAATAFIVGWSGFCIHAQSISITSTTDINSYLYIFSKFLHALISYIAVYILYPIFTLFLSFSIPVFSPYEELSRYENLFNDFKLSVEFFILVLVILLIFSLITGFFVYLLSLFRNKKK